MFNPLCLTSPVTLSPPIPLSDFHPPILSKAPSIPFYHLTTSIPICCLLFGVYGTLIWYRESLCKSPSNRGRKSGRTSDGRTESRTRTARAKRRKEMSEKKRGFGNVSPPFGKIIPNFNLLKSFAASTHCDIVCLFKEIHQSFRTPVVQLNQGLRGQRRAVRPSLGQSRWTACRVGSTSSFHFGND